jgi:hypothetical protein
MNNKNALNLIAISCLSLSLTAYSAVGSAAPQCATTLTTSSAAGNDINSIIQELAKLRLNLDLEKNKGGSTLARTLEAKYRQNFAELANHPELKLSADELKAKIQTEIIKLQNVNSEIVTQETQAREEQMVIKKNFWAEWATPEQLAEQEAKALNVRERYYDAAVKVPFFTSIRAKKWTAKNSKLTSPPLTKYDRILRELTGPTLSPWIRVELQNHDGKIIGESWTPQDSTDAFVDLLALVQKSMGEAWATNSFFEIKKVVITHSHSLSIHEMTDDNVESFLRIKRLMEALEFKDVEVEGSTLAFADGTRTLVKQTLTLPASHSAIKGDYKTSWNHFHQNSNTLGEFAAPIAYAKRILDGEVQENRVKHYRDLYEKLIAKYLLTE